MSRLIDADELIKDILDLRDCYNGFSDTYDKACIIGVIDEQPTIEERMTGKWIKKDCDLLYCSECDLPSLHPWPYCERCGAKMGEKSD